MNDNDLDRKAEKEFIEDVEQGITNCVFVMGILSPLWFIIIVLVFLFAQ